MFQRIKKYLEQKLNPPEEPKQIVLYEDDWHDLCVVMRTLTWGKHPDMDLWHRMRERVNERNGITKD